MSPFYVFKTFWQQKWQIYPMISSFFLLLKIYFRSPKNNSIKVREKVMIALNRAKHLWHRSLFVQIFFGIAVGKREIKTFLSSASITSKKFFFGMKAHRALPYTRKAPENFTTIMSSTKEQLSLNFYWATFAVTGQLNCISKHLQFTYLKQLFLSNRIIFTKIPVWEVQI